MSFEIYFAMTYYVLARTLTLEQSGIPDRLAHLIVAFVLSDLHLTQKGMSIS